MVVYEVKDTWGLTQRKKPRPIRRDIRPASPVYEPKAINHLLNRQYSGERKQRKREPVKLNNVEIRDVQRLTEQVNSRLENNGAGIHLMLVQEKDGFALDVYDCSDDNVCQVVHDMIVRVDELQSLFARLQKESGIIIDKKF